MCLNSKELNYVSLLHEIATEHNFEGKFHQLIAIH